MVFQGVIFDMDGTLTAPYFDFAKLRMAANIGDRDMIDYLGEVDGVEYERVHRLLIQFEEEGVANVRLNRGAHKVLQYLMQRGIPSALLTRNSRRSVEAVCKKLRLQFDICVSREEGPCKPAPEPVWSIARRWGSSPRDLLVVGDYKWDLLCAQNAGAPCAILTNGNGVPDWAHKADYIIHRLTELIQIFEGKRKPQKW